MFWLNAEWSSVMIIGFSSAAFSRCSRLMFSCIIVLRFSGIWNRQNILSLTKSFLFHVTFFSFHFFGSNSGQHVSLLSFIGYWWL